MSDFESDTMDEDDFDYSQEDEQDFVFEPVIPEKDIKRSYDVEYQCYSPTDIEKIQKEEISHVCNILGCTKENASTLLRHFKWNKERLIESYMENEELVKKEAGVIMDIREPKLITVPGFSCDICCNDEENLSTFALSCEHRFCVDCYEHYLTDKIKEGESRFITCAAECNLIVDEKAIQLLVKPEICQKYNILLLRGFVDDHKSLHWCPFPNCENAVKCMISKAQLDTIVPTVECSAGHRFCFGCGEKDHQPAICDVVKRWLKKCADDSETSNWIAANTKECVKCFSMIEKNGGCNHMTCRKCKHEFCWICLGPWADHGTSWYNCSRYEEKESVDARDAQTKSRQALERYLHYYNRYANHDQSAKLDKQLYEATEKKMEVMQKSSDFSWIQVQFLKSAVDVLLKSRGTLMWTYALAYYLARNSNATALFEDNQRDLEMAVEELSGMLETLITPENAAEIRQKVLDKTEYVNRRRQILLSDTAAGHLERRWEYSF
ncbi:hypothetical protein HDV01_000070 [Terramyces sp. JEL0728]|nr:hypothetical protein HDV01_000070 [Terramyces sp. JEL0728]